MHHGMNGSVLTPAPSNGTVASEPPPPAHTHADANNPGTFFTRVGSKYPQLRALATNSVANTRPKRAAAHPARSQLILLDSNHRHLGSNATWYLTKDTLLLYVTQILVVQASTVAVATEVGCVAYIALLFVGKHGSVLSSRAFD